jgi:signal transduction histidine kinase
VDVNELVGEAVSIFRRELEDHDIELELDLSPHLPPVEGDRVQLQQVLINLVLNAVDALKAVPPENRTIAIETRKVERSARIEVSDTGPGIDEADLDRVFEPFFSTKETGMGMGLSICSTIAQAHSGKLTVKRNPNRGVTFELSLPVQEPAVDS